MKARRLFISVSSFLFVLIGFSFIAGIVNSSEIESPYKLPYPAGKEYKVTQGNFGKKSHNKEVDKGKAIYAFDFDSKFDGNPVVASRSGKVMSVQDKFGRGGRNADPNKANYVLIDHGDGTSALYLHLLKDSIIVKEGEEVLQGQIIGKADSSGYVTGAHLHFQVQITPQKVWYDSSRGYNLGWYTQSIQISFSDKDVLAKEPDGIPKEGKSYISDNGAPEITPQPVACPPEGKPKFVIGQEVVADADLRIRGGPGLAYPEIKKAGEAGGEGKILEGPICADNYVWWKIEYKDGTVGWSVENWLEVREAITPQLTPMTFTDPFAYCAAVGTVDKQVRWDDPASFPSLVDERWAGAPMPDEIKQRLGGAPPFGSFTWRCFEGKVMACVWAAHTWCGMADTSVKPSDFTVASCREDGHFIGQDPFLKATVYAWDCIGGEVVLVGPKVFYGPAGQVTEASVDPRGFISQWWLERALSKEGRFWHWDFGCVKEAKPMFCGRGIEELTSFPRD